jgi:hypothetical protein
MPNDPRKIIPLEPKETNYLLRMVRARIAELSLGLHRYFLNRGHKSKTKEDLLPELKSEMTILEGIRQKLWGRKNVQTLESSQQKQQDQKKDTTD